jgi:hypothetical protein
MFIKRMAIASVAALATLSLGYVASANPAQAPHFVQASMTSSPIAKVSDERDQEHQRRYHRRRIAKSQDWYYAHPHRFRDSGPPYSRCYMNCVQSGHPGDFCEVASYHFC